MRKQGEENQAGVTGRDLLECYPAELEAILRAWQQPAYRAKQLFHWLHVEKVTSYAAMTNLPLALRQELEERYPLCPPSVVKQVRDPVDETEKILLCFPDGAAVESVQMRYSHGLSICVSSQVGCRMGCRFCASTVDGCERSLTAAEMLQQVYQFQRQTTERISHVVVMGSGEPLENRAAVVRFLRLLMDPAGMNLSGRHLTVSTCGLVSEIYQLAEEDLPITLAISLHAADDETRQKMMPIAKKYPLSELLPACRTYYQKTGRRLTLEYALISGVNDSEQDAEKLAVLARDLQAHVNLIPINPVAERNWHRPTRETIVRFHEKLEKNGINDTIRREMGLGIDGACGQLRKRYIETDQENQA